MFIGTSKRSMLSHPRVQSWMASLPWGEGDTSENGKKEGDNSGNDDEVELGHIDVSSHISEVQLDLTQSMALMLAVFWFGILVPPLLLFAPVAAWFQLSSLRWAEEKQSQQSIGELLASEVMVQQPLQEFEWFGFAGMITITIVASVDLEIGWPPVIFYAVCSLLIVAFNYAKRWHKRWISTADGADAHCIEFSLQTPTNPKISVNPMCDLRDKRGCVPLAASGHGVEMEVECTELGEQSVIQRGQMKPIGWMKKQKKAGNLSSEQFHALKHMRSREGMSPKQSPASKASAVIKRQIQSGAEPPSGGSVTNIDDIPDEGKHSSPTFADEQDAKAATIGRVRRTRQARKKQPRRNDSEQPSATHKQQKLTKLKQKRRAGQITTEQFEALQAKAIIDI